MKLLFIVNPKSGKGQIKSNLLEILDIFVRAGYEPTMHITQSVLDAKETVKARGAQYDCIVCSGGDGTLNETVAGLLEEGLNVPLCYIPAGSTNDFASSLKIPKNMKNAARLIAEGRQFQCDVGSFNERYFNYVAAFGAFTEVSYATPQQMKNVLGYQAYIIEGMKKLTSIKPAIMEVEHDGKLIEGEFLYGMISNSTSVGGFKKLVGKSVRMDDGVFEVTLLRKPKGTTELQNILTSIISADMSSEALYTFKASQLTIHSPGEVPWVLDGEYGGAPKEISVNVREKALNIFCPQDFSA